MFRIIVLIGFFLSSMAYGHHGDFESRGFRGFKSHCKCKPGAGDDHNDLTDPRGFRGFHSSYNTQPMTTATPKVMAKTAPAPVATPVKRETFATLDVPFAVNSTKVGNQWQTKIVAFLKTLEGKKYSAVELKGFSDPSGNAAYNEKLSVKRAQAVESVIKTKSKKTHDLKVVGAGVRTGTTAAEARVVEIRVLK